MADVFIAAATRTPFGRYGGRLAAVRCDDLAAVPIMSLMSRYPSVDWGAVDEVVLGCANQAGEDNRNVARMALLLSGLPETVPAVTVNRLCASRVGSSWSGGARDRLRRCRAGDCRRRRKYVARSVCSGESRGRVRSRTKIGGQHSRVAFHQPPDASALRSRFHDANSGQPRARTWNRSRLSGRVHLAQPAAHHAGTG